MHFFIRRCFGSFITILFHSLWCKTSHFYIFVVLSFSSSYILPLMVLNFYLIWSYILLLRLFNHLFFRGPFLPALFSFWFFVFLLIFNIVFFPNPSFSNILAHLSRPLFRLSMLYYHLHTVLLLWWLILKKKGNKMLASFSLFFLFGTG